MVERDGAGGVGSGKEEEDGDCQQTILRLYHFLDGELTEDKRDQISRHLDECISCLEAYDFEAELREAIATRCREDLPAGLMERIVDVLRLEAESGSSGS